MAPSIYYFLFTIYYSCMLSVFPEILFLSPFAATILRAAAAYVFFYAAVAQMSQSAALSEVSLPVLGKGKWIVWISVVFDIVVGVMLLTGSYTQIAAIMGMMGAAAALTFMSPYAERIPLARGSIALVFLILFSLLLTGAGAFAFDLPL